MTIRLDGEILSIYASGSWTKIGVISNRVLTLKPQSHILEISDKGYLLPYDFMSDPRLFDHLVFENEEDNIIYVLNRAEVVEVSEVIRLSDDQRKLFLSIELIHKLNNTKHGI